MYIYTHVWLIIYNTRVYIYIHIYIDTYLFCASMCVKMYGPKKRIETLELFWQICHESTCESPGELVVKSRSF